MMNINRILLWVLFLFPFLGIKSQVCPTITDANNNDKVVINCSYPFVSGSCINLKVDFPQLVNTSSYSTPQKINYMPVGNLNAGTPINDFKDDEYIKRINFNSFGSIPFNFSFYGKVYESVLVSSNGYITFNENFNEGDFSTAEIIAQKIPSSYLPELSVFGVYQDLDFSGKEGNIFYRIEGKAPCRKLVVNFYNGKIARTNQFTSSQIVLYEGTNNIEVYVENKPIPDMGAKMRESVIGIVDDQGNGIAAANDRNTGVWSANKEGYRFSPNGSLIDPVIKWYNSAKELLPVSGNNVIVCPDKPDVYSAIATYNIDNEELLLQDNIDITYNNDFPVAKNYTHVFCDASVQVIYQADYNGFLTYQTDVSLLKFKYYLDLASAQNPTSISLDSSLPLDQNKVYFVRVESANNSSCYEIVTLKFMVLNDLLKTTTVNVCDANNDRIEADFVLNSLVCQLFPEDFAYQKLEYFVDNTTTPLTTATITTNSKIYVKVTTAQCTAKLLGPISVNFTSAPSVIGNNTLVFDYVNKECDVITNDNPQFTEPFDWELEFKNRGIVLTNDTNVVKIKFYYTEDAARKNGTSLVTIKEGLPVDSYLYDVFARVEYANADCTGTCFSIVKFSAKVQFTKIILNVDDADEDVLPDDPLVFDTEPADIYLCYDIINRDVNLDTDSQKIIKLISPTSGVTITYHNTYAEANDPLNLGINPSITLPSNVITKTYLIRYAIGSDCYVIKPIIYHIIDPIAERLKIDVCNNTNSSSLSIILANYDRTILGSQWSQLPKPTVKYYSDVAAMNEITDLNVTSADQYVYAKIISGLADVCSKIYQVRFKLINFDGVLETKKVIKFTCDNLNDSKELVNLNDYISHFVDPAFQSNYSFVWYGGYTQNTNVLHSQITTPTNFLLTKNVTVYLKISSLGSTCFRKGDLVLEFDFAAHPQIQLAATSNVQRCNVSGAQNVIFDLDEAIPQLYSETINPPFKDFIQSVSYYENKTDAELGNANFIGNFKNYLMPSTVPVKVIHARFLSKYGCFSVAPINLKIIGGIKFNTLNSIKVCDDNLDGIYQYNLKVWLDANKNTLLTPTDASPIAQYTFLENGIPLSATDLENYEINMSQPSISLKAEIAGGCLEITNLNFVLTPFITKTFVLKSCDVNNDNKETINLTQFETQLKLTDETFEYYESLSNLNSGSKILDPANFNYDSAVNSNKVYVKVASSTACPNLAIIDLVLNTTPIFSISDFYVCPKEKQSSVAPDFTGLGVTDVIWKNSAGTAFSGFTASDLSADQYTVTATSANGCSYTTTFKVIEKEVPVITSLAVVGNTYTIVATGSKKILYSKDGINWQESNIFSGLPKGEVTFYVKFENEICIGETRKGNILSFPNTFTPNGDGINDVWILEGIGVFGNELSELKIYDRFGRLIFTQLASDRLTWDGTSNGRKMPTSTYWYTVKLPDGRHYDGFILLKSRD